MNNKENLAENIIMVLMIFLTFILIYEMAIAAAKDVVRLENSRNPIIVFPPNDSTSISSPIYMNQ